MEKIKRYILLAIVLLIVTGCKTDKKEEVKIEVKDKGPSYLSDFSQEIQNILNEVEEIEKILDDTSIEENKNKIKKIEEENRTTNINSKQDNKDNEDNEDDGGNKGDGQEDNQPYILNKDEKILSIWIKIDKAIEEIHNKWNLYEVESLEKGISMETRQKVEKALNSLTKSIENRDILDIYDYASQSMLNISDIFNMYKDEIKGNINKIKSYVYQSYLNVIQERKRYAKELLEESKEEINQIRLKLGEDEDKIKILEKTNLSIENMKESLEEDSIKLYRIKKEIIIKNLDELGE